MTVHDIPACRWYERVWNEGDVNAIAEMTTPDLKAHGADGVVRDRAMFAEFQRAMRGALPDVHVDIKHCVHSGDMAAVHWVAIGTHTGTADGMPKPTGKRIEVSGLTMVRMEGDLIAEGWDDLDLVGLMRELGAAV